MESLLDISNFPAALSCVAVRPRSTAIRVAMTMRTVDSTQLSPPICIAIKIWVNALAVAVICVASRSSRLKIRRATS